MKILKRIIGYYWIIIPIIIGIFLFSMPLWYTYLMFNSDSNFKEEIKEHHQNTSLVDYSISNNLKVRHIRVYDLGLKDSVLGLHITSESGNISYLPDNINEAKKLLDILQNRKTGIEIELTLNSQKDTLEPQEKIQLRQNAIDLIGHQNIQKATFAEALIFKETNYIIQTDIKYPIKKDDEYAVLLGWITFKDGKLIDYN